MQYWFNIGRTSWASAGLHPKLAFWFLVVDYCCPQTGAGYIDWAEQSRLYLMTETDTSLRNVTFQINLELWIMSRMFVILTTHHTERCS
jgi:hypothetical protein